MLRASSTAPVAARMPPLQPAPNGMLASPAIMISPLYGIIMQKSCNTACLTPMASLLDACKCVSVTCMSWMFLWLACVWDSCTGRILQLSALEAWIYLNVIPQRAFARLGSRISQDANQASFQTTRTRWLAHGKNCRAWSQAILTLPMAALCDWLV